LVHRSYVESDSFGGQAYYSEEDNRLVVSFAGSTDWGDLVADVDPSGSVAFGGEWTSQIVSAQEFVQTSLENLPEGAQVVFTGHSLGGFHAQVHAQNNSNTAAIVFNAPGVGGLGATSNPAEVVNGGAFRSQKAGIEHAKEWIARSFSSLPGTVPVHCL
jgi:hypothetical protein